MTVEFSKRANQFKAEVLQKQENERFRKTCERVGETIDHLMKIVDFLLDLYDQGLLELHSEIDWNYIERGVFPILTNPIVLRHDLELATAEIPKSGITYDDRRNQLVATLHQIDPEKLLIRFSLKTPDKGDFDYQSKPAGYLTIVCAANHISFLSRLKRVSESPISLFDKLAEIIDLFEISVIQKKATTSQAEPNNTRSMTPYLAEIQYFPVSPDSESDQYRLKPDQSAYLGKPFQALLTDEDILDDQTKLGLFAKMIESMAQDITEYQRISEL